MPLKGKRRFRRKARKGRRRRVARRRRNGPSMAIVRSPNIVPDRLRVKLTYYKWVVMTSTGGAFDVFQFRGNSLFDPAYTSGNDQPSGFDQWALLYNGYRVNASKLSVNFVTVGSSVASSTLMCAIEARPTVSLPLNLKDLFENPYRKHIIANVGNQSRNIVSMYMSTRKIEGIS